MWLAKHTAALTVLCALGMLAAELAQAQECSSIAWEAKPWEAKARKCSAIAGQGATPWLDADGLLPPCHNPASVPPADKPQPKDHEDLKPAVPMSEQMCTAIRLFDVEKSSERNYDLVNCLDGLTFGFGNWPQSKLGTFFKKLVKDPKAESALVVRFLEVFKAQPDAWNSFRKFAQLGNVQADAVTIQTVIKKIGTPDKLKDKSKNKYNKNVKGLKNNPNGTCKLKSALAPGTSFYFDHAKWLVPALQRAFRDPAVVAFQVRYWEEDALKDAKRYAKNLGLPEEGVFLMAFYKSNRGQLPSLQPAIEAKNKKPPKTLHAGGKDWKWDGSNRPSALAGISIDRWHTLLIWQAMCQARSDQGKGPRNRNLKFFEEYLFPDFMAPIATESGKPSAEKHPENCDPEQIKLNPHPNLGG
jgi:hypothetical protein